MMTANLNRKNHLVEASIGGVGGFDWNRLHAEREDICEAMLKDCAAASQATTDVDKTTADAHRRVLEARLRHIDDALDRLMSGQ